jgi:1,4-alpha-glucan branching enzyme
MDYIKEKLGSWQIGNSQSADKVRFKVFFPSINGEIRHNIKSIQVTGDFQGQLGQAAWDAINAPALSKAPHPEGELWSYETPVDLKAGFYEYKYYVTFNDASEPPRWVSDPCTRYGGRENMNAGFVIGGSQPADNVISPLTGGRLPLRDLIIYEMMIDDFTDEYRGVRAPLDAVRDKIKLENKVGHLKKLGINAILFMPWTAWNDSKFNWGYTPSLYFSVGYRYANNLFQPEEKLSWLKKLIDLCHQEGIHVIMDGVFNHVYPGFPYKSFYQTYDIDCPYTGKFYGDFEGLQDLDFNQKCTRQFIRDVCFYWIDTFKIDGIRFDNTINFYSDETLNGLPQLLHDIDAHLNGLGEQNFSLTLEHLQLNAASITNHTKATSYWDNALYGGTFDALWNNTIPSKLLNALNTRRYLEDALKRPTVYLSNHDHSHVNWQAGARSNDGALQAYRTQPYLIAMMTSSGTPMIQNGQEFGEDHWIPEDDHGSGRRVQPRPLHWSYVEDKIGLSLFNLYSKLCEIRITYEVLRTGNFYPDYWEEWQTQFNPAGFGVDSHRNLMIFKRYGHASNGEFHQFMVVINFANGNQRVTVNFSDNGLWTDLISGWTPSISNYQLEFEIGSNWGHIFFKG